MTKKKPGRKPHPGAEPIDLIKVREEMGTTIAVGLPHPDEALVIYKQLGPTRSMAKIAIYLSNMGRRAPAIGTLKAWSKKGNWGYHAREYDLEITRQADAKIQAELGKEAAHDLTTRTTKMSRVLDKALKRLNERIEHVPIKSGGEFRAVVEACVSLNKAVEVLNGGVSDRTERLSTVEERKEDAAKIVRDAFSKLNADGGDGSSAKQSDGTVGDATDAGSGPTQVH